MNNFIKRDGRFVIGSRANYTPEQKAALAGIKRNENIDKRIPLTPTNEWKIQKLLYEADKLGYKQPVKFIEVPVPKHKKKDKTSNKKHHTKKGKKMREKVRKNLSERSIRCSNLMAELLKKTDYLIKAENSLWAYNNETGCYDAVNHENIAAKLRTLLDEKERLRVSIREYREAYEQLMISQELMSDVKFLANKPFVNCLNGVVDVANEKLMTHSPSYRFKHFINARYNPDANCKHFLRYVETITAGDAELAELLQVMMGYLISHYNNAKTAFLIIGVSNTGKSVLCEVLKNVIGKNYVSHADLSRLHHQEYAADMSGKILNIAPDLSNEPLKDVGFFKSLVSHNDTIAARKLYCNPENIKGETKMLFASNHLLNFDSSLDIGDIEAVFNRFIFFPFQNQPVTAKTDDKNLSEKMISEEIDGIFTWAMTGLKKYISNSECFPHAKLSDKIKQKNAARFCPEKTFFDKCIVIDNNAVESTNAVKKAYAAYCQNNDITSRGNINDYIKNHKHIVSKKKRIDDSGNLLKKGNPRSAYIGIRVKEKYRSQ